MSLYKIIQHLCLCVHHSVHCSSVFTTVFAVDHLVHCPQTYSPSSVQYIVQHPAFTTQFTIFFTIHKRTHHTVFSALFTTQCLMYCSASNVQHTVLHYPSVFKSLFSILSSGFTGPPPPRLACPVAIPCADLKVFLANRILWRFTAHCLWCTVAMCHQAMCRQAVCHLARLCDVSPSHPVSPDHPCVTEPSMSHPAIHESPSHPCITHHPCVTQPSLCHPTIYVSLIHPYVTHHPCVT